MSSSPYPAIQQLAALLDEGAVGYQFIGSTALWLQGVRVPPVPMAEVSVQWDQLEEIHRRLPLAGPIGRAGKRAWFQCEVAGVPVRVECQLNTVVAADPHRVAVRLGEASHGGVVSHGGEARRGDGVVSHGGEARRGDGVVWAKSLLECRRLAPAGDPAVPLINARLREMQAELARQNSDAWSHETYEAWVERYGEPAEAAARIAADPAARLAPLNDAIGDVRGQTIANLMGSHGGKAVALALLGGQVTVVDVSPTNAAYATALAGAAGVGLRYVVADVLDLPPGERTGAYDLVLMELGILHYFVDLMPLAETIRQLLRPGGRLVLHDFHPVSTKLIASTGKKHKVTGNYFDAGLRETEVAFSKYLTAGTQPRVRLRRWTLGEIVTAVAEAGLCVVRLTEEPNTKLDDIGLPKTFTLVARRM